MSAAASTRAPGGSDPAASRVIAGAVHPFVVQRAQRAQTREQRRPRQDPLREARVLPHLLPFAVGQRPLLLPHARRHARAPDVVHVAGAPHLRDRLRAQAQPLGRARRQLRHARRMPARVRRLQIRERAHRLQRAVDRRLVDVVGRARLGGDRRVPHRTPRPAPPGSRPRPRAPSPPASGPAPCPPAPPASPPRPSTPPVAVERLRVVGDLHDAHRQRDRLALLLARRPLAVPPLERVPQRLAHAHRTPEIVRQRLRDLALRFDRPGQPRHLDEQPRVQPRPLQRRLARADVAASARASRPPACPSRTSASHPRAAISSPPNTAAAIGASAVQPT